MPSSREVTDATAPAAASGAAVPPGGAPPRDRRAVRREQFLDAADSAIRKDGAGVTMADVAAAAGVTKPVLYRYVSDKGDLVQALAIRYAGRLEPLLEEGTRSSDDPRAMIERTIDAYLTFIESEPAIYEFLVHRAPSDSPGVAEYLDRFTAQLADRIAAIVAAELTRAGKQTDGSEAFAHGMVGMVQSAGEWWLSKRSGPQSMTREQLVGHLVRVLWTGLAGLPDQSRPQGA
ncbi:TetR/AcrR family transcriptional regulator [Euzebya sp.]|uniref:TetR/AcrR family transcriptional regulator n=1 Tax=Euzebya sp. TaxID=1971409 RepID=UPI003515BA24